MAGKTSARAPAFPTRAPSGRVASHMMDLAEIVASVNSTCLDFQSTVWRVQRRGCRQPGGGLGRRRIPHQLGPKPDNRGHAVQGAEL